MTTQTQHTPPKSIGGIKVTTCGEPLNFKGQTFVTLAPEDENEDGLWEFSLTTGKLIQTRKP